MAGVRAHALAHALHLLLTAHPFCLRRALTRARRALLEVAELAAQRGVLAEVAQVALHGRRVALQRLLLLAHRAREVDDGAVGLELREAALENGAGAVAAELLDEVDRHVVGRPEARVERIRASRGERGDRLRVEAARPLDDRVTLRVDAAPACPAGELGVLPRRDGHARLAVELLELLEHDSACGHVDAEGERLRREDHAQQLLLEELFDDLLEGRQKTGMVGGDAALQPVEPLPVAEHREVVVAQRAAALFDDRADLVALRLVGEAKTRAHELADGGVAPRPTEDEEDRGQQVLGPEHPRDRRTIHAALLAAEAAGAPRALLPPLGVVAATAVHLRPAGARELHEFGIHAVRGRLPRRVEEVEHLRPHEHVLRERYGAGLAHDDVGVAAHGLQPVAELLGVGDCRAQGDEPHCERQVDDHFLPHGPAEPVGEVVHLVHDDVGQIGQERRIGVEHVAQHLGRHHDDARARVDVRVAREQPYLARSVLGDELRVLLVAERLHGRRVEDLRLRLEHREEHAELGHDRLARTRGGGDEHAATFLERLARGKLERVEVYRETVAEGAQSGKPPQGARCRVSFGRRGFCRRHAATRHRWGCRSLRSWPPPSWRLDGRGTLRSPRRGSTGPPWGSRGGTSTARQRQEWREP